MAVPTLLRVGLSEAVAYRAEMVVWVLATTMPFVMLMLWSAVSAYSPVVSPRGTRYGATEFTAYFLAVAMTRQLISSWAAWEMNWEIRTGALSMRLLRPLHPIIAYGAQNVAFMPLRLVVSLPLILIALFVGATRHWTTDPVLFLLFLGALAGGWLINFFVNIALGSLGMVMESSIKLMEFYLALFFVLSGYLFPLELFPEWMRRVAEALPFRYQIGLPVEILLGHHTASEAVGLLAKQWGWVVALFALAITLWNVGVKRFQAYGG